MLGSDLQGWHPSQYRPDPMKRKGLIVGVCNVQATCFLATLFKLFPYFVANGQGGLAH